MGSDMEGKNKVRAKRTRNHLAKALEDKKYRQRRISKKYKQKKLQEIEQLERTSVRDDFTE